MARPLESIPAKLGLGVALLVLAVIALISYGSINRFVDGAHLVDHTHRVMLQLEEFMYQLEAAVATQRGYLISGNERYLQRYEVAAKALPQQIQALREMTADNPQQQKSLTRLGSLVSGRLALLEHAIEIREAARLNPASARSVLVEGQAIMDQIRELVSAMKQEEEGLLEERSRVFEKDRIATTVIIVFGNAAAFLFLWFAFVVLTREVRERKKAEADVRRHAEQLEDLYNNATCGYQSTDENGVFVLINDTELNWLGYTREEMIEKMSMPDILTPASRDAFQQNFALFKERGSLRDVEFDLVRKDGTLLPVSLSATAVRDKTGNYLMSRSTLFDITERRKAERELRQANSFLDSVFEHIPAMVFVKDAKDLTFVRHNKANQQLLGYSEAEVLGKSDYDLFPKEQADFFTGKDRVVLSGKVVVDIPEESIQTRDRGLRLLHTRKIPVFDAAGNPRYLLGISEDITERKRAEQVLSESQQRLDLALRSARLGAWELDLVTDTSVRSLRHDQIFGYQALLPNWGAEIFMRHVVLEDRESVTKCFEDAFRTGSFSMECRINRADNCVRWIAAEGQVYRDSSGEPVKMMGVVADTTERKEAEERIRALNASLEQQSTELKAANKELESFSYSVSHDLRSPLRAIDGFSLMLQEDYAASLDDEGKRLLRVIQDNSRKMALLIDDLLAFSRLGRQPIEAVEVDMTALAQEVFQEVLASADHVSPRLVLGSLPAARGDRALLRQVWVNLLSNALKYSGTTKEPLIEVTGQLNGSQTIYSVKDNGVGFDMQYYAKLFGVFQRLHSAEEFPGTGVGLAIVQRVVTRHGGRVWAEGKLNEGATFHFSLPKG